jgi:thioredoxin-related protein
MMIKQPLFTVLLLFFGAAFADPPHPTYDWAGISNVARAEHSPILVVFNSETCGYCQRLKHEVIEPLTHNHNQKLPLIREFDIYSKGKIIDFNGDPIRSRQFKRRYNIYAVPTLILLGPDGTPLTDPIVGYNSQKEYLELLQTSLVASFQAIGR